MTAAGLPVFDTTLRETNTWLQEIQDTLGWGDRQLAYHALRGTLHALRDFLTVEEAADLGAQLPLLVRGIYYDRYTPARMPTEQRKREDFLRRVGAEFERLPPVDPELMARTALQVLARHISPGEAEDVRQMLPAEMRALWPADAAGRRA